MKRWHLWVLIGVAIPVLLALAISDGIKPHKYDWRKDLGKAA